MGLEHSRRSKCCSVRAGAARGGSGSSRAGLDPVRQLKQGLLAVDHVQVMHVGFQLMVLFRGHVTSKLVGPAVSQGADSVCNHMQLFKIDKVIQKCFISFMNKCDIFQQ